MISIVTLAAIALLASAAPVQTSPAQPVSDEMLNTPGVNGWSVYGAGLTSKLHRDKMVQGEGALRIDVASASANPWDIGAVAPVTGTIAKNDRLVVAFWAKLVAGETAEVPVFLQLSSAPHTPVVQGNVMLGKEWKLVSITGDAGAAYGPGKTNVVLHLGGAPLKAELGPIFVMRVK
jgi:endoglucanase